MVKKTYLCRGVNLCLPRILSLSQHGRGQELIAVFSTDKFGSFEEYSSTIGPRHALPLCLCSESTIDSSCDSSFIGFVVCAQMVGVVVRDRLFCELSGLDLKGE